MKKEIERIIREFALDKRNKEGIDFIVDDLLSLFKQQMKEIMPKNKKLDFSQSNTQALLNNGFNQAIDQILNNIESL